MKAKKVPRFSETYRCCYLLLTTTKSLVFAVGGTVLCNCICQFEHAMTSQHPLVFFTSLKLLFSDTKQMTDRRMFNKKKHQKLEAKYFYGDCVKFASATFIFNG